MHGEDNIKFLVPFMKILKMSQYTQKLSLCTPQSGVEAQLHSFLTSALDGGEWSASRPGRFTFRE